MNETPYECNIYYITSLKYPKIYLKYITSYFKIDIQNLIDIHQ